MFARSSVAVLVFAGLASPTAAQSERYDSGRKLIAFEIAWDAQPDASARKRTLPPLKKTLNSFFAGKSAEAGKSLDEARHALASEKPPTDVVRWADSLVIRPALRLADPKKGPLKVELVSLYDPGVAFP